MKDTFWIVVTKDGARDMRKGRRSKYDAPERPALKVGEYAVLVTLEVPDAVFRSADLPSVSVVVPEAVVARPVARVTVEPPPALPEPEP